MGTCAGVDHDDHGNDKYYFCKVSRFSKFIMIGNEIAQCLFIDC